MFYVRFDWILLEYQSNFHYLATPQTLKDSEHAIQFRESQPGSYTELPQDVYSYRPYFRRAL